ncbi:ArsR family transcriptional regulator [Alteromonadaceae bacterium M269]|nr:ArsR family transcriptional regulator [Alteromonadaceae bacterium M269]
MDKFVAISDPTRRKIIEMLSIKELTSGEIADHFQCSAPAISQHLKVLKTVDIVGMRIDAQKRVYSLRKESLKEVECWASEVSRIWNKQLDSLEQALNQPEN